MHYDTTQQVWVHCDDKPIVYDIHTDTFPCSVCGALFSHNEGPDEPRAIGITMTNVTFEPAVAGVNAIELKRGPGRPRKTA